MFTLIPGSEFGADTSAAIESVGGRTVPWSEARQGVYDLVVTASPKGDPGRLRGPHLLLPHGAGFNKSLPREGRADSASGLDPAYLSRSRDDAPITLYALAHPDQLARLAATVPHAADGAKVVGDPTLDRILASRGRRDRYRDALGTGARTLIVLTSTWGPHSLLRQRPELPARLAGHLPHDEYQVALIVHPNEWSELGSYDLAQRLEPALSAGLLLPRPRDEWASVLVAADAVVTDHGSTALYFTAASDGPVVSACRGGGELITGSPMDVLLRSVPELGDHERIEDALDACRPGPGRTAARAAFAHQGETLRRLRAELYALLDLDPPPLSPSVPLLPSPAPAARVPTGFDVTADVLDDTTVRIARHPVGLGAPGHHLAVEYGAASEQLMRSAGLLYWYAGAATALAPRARLSWTFEGWADHVLTEYPACRTTAALLPAGRCLVRVRGHDRSYVARVGPSRAGGRVARVDPAAAVSALHAWLGATGGRPPADARLTCVTGERSHPVSLRVATAEEVREEILGA
ncbi:translation initiation factor 2 [Streptomyces sp. VRA16 Mangrove soil]|uniref:translation initiation factor 2 n=1 Tax=Streptomyces sp. VRA16 Mangrove soil TaxID=2817434 RepID=UPI001E2C59B2|nr:translation initiation factor 2 [Streptomyces sp. VRA16 Mangrove soil]